MPRKEMKILEQIEPWRTYNYMKAHARMARLRRKAKILEQIEPWRIHNHMRAHARIGRQVLNDSKPERSLGMMELILLMIPCLAVHCRAQPHEACGTTSDGLCAVNAQCDCA